MSVSVMGCVGFGFFLSLTLIFSVFFSHFRIYIKNSNIAGYAHFPSRDTAINGKAYLESTVTFDDRSDTKS